MTDIQSLQSQILATGINTPQLRATQFQALVAYNIPADGVAAAQSQFIVAFRQQADISVTQAQILVAYRGRPSNPKLRAWTFSLDGHDFYVLRLGDRLTLVYDVYSEQWVDWADLESLTWRANTGINWQGAQALANSYGSNVVVGDDNFGLLWFLDPKQPFDEHPDYLSETQQIYFDRITMGQVPMKGREVLPAYVTWLTSDMGDPAYLEAGINLSISDDAGNTFIDVGTVTVTEGTYSPQIAWYSLGQIQAPGRLFKLVDDGALARIDSFEMNDPDDGR
jgi:hypothetical protein